MKAVGNLTFSYDDSSVDGINLLAFCVRKKGNYTGVSNCEVRAVKPTIMLLRSLNQMHFIFLLVVVIVVCISNTQYWAKFSLDLASTGINRLTSGI